jgi:hypothetical protein
MVVLTRFNAAQWSKVAIAFLLLLQLGCTEPPKGAKAIGWRNVIHPATEICLRLDNFGWRKLKNPPDNHAALIAMFGCLEPMQEPQTGWFEHEQGNIMFCRNENEIVQYREFSSENGTWTVTSSLNADYGASELFCEQNAAKINVDLSDDA